MKTVLVIKNDEDVVDIIDIMYQNSEYDVIKAPARVNVGQVAEINPNIIILDHFYEEGYGAQLYTEIRTHAKIKHIPVLICSAHHDMEHLEKVGSANGFITKPFDLYSFMKLVDSLVN